MKRRGSKSGLLLLVGAALLSLASTSGDQQGWDSNDFLIAGFSTDVDILVAPTADLAITKNDATTAAIPGGSVTYTITVSHAGLGRLYSYDFDARQIREINPATGVVVNSFQQPGNPASVLFGLATTPTTLLAGGSNTEILFELDPDTGVVLRILDNPGVNVRGLAFLEGEIFILGLVPAGQITVLDYTTGSILRRISAAPVSTGLSASRTALYGTDGNTLYAVDPLTGATTDLGILGGVDSEGIGIIGGELFNGNPSQIEVFDLATLTPLRTLTGLNALLAVGADGAGIGVDVTGATVADLFPPELSCTWTCAATGAANCTAGPVAGDIDDTVDIPVGDSVTYTAICDVSAAATGTLTNTATVTLPAGLPDPYTANNSSTDVDVLTPPKTDLVITKDDGMTAADPGGSVTYTITVDNRGIGPQGTRLLGSSYPIPSSPAILHSIDPTTGATTTIGPIGFDEVGALDVDPQTGTVYALALRPSDNTRVLITIDPTTGAGTEVGPIAAELSFDLSFRNADSVLYANGQISPCMVMGTVDPINAAVALLGATTNCSSGNAIGFSPTDVLYHLDRTSGGTLHTVDQATGVATPLTPLTYVGFPPSLDFPVVHALDFDPRTGMAFAVISETFVETSYLGLLDPATGTMTLVGQTVNDLNGLAFLSAGHDAAGALVTDAFPPELSCTWTCSPSAGASCTAGPVIGDILDTVDIPKDSSVTYTAACAVDPSALDSLVNTATVTAPPPVVDADLANNSSTDVDSLPQMADLSVTKDDSRDPTAAGGPLSYTVRVDNAGPSAATLVVVTDTLPAGISLVSTSGCANDPAGVPACDLGTIPDGGSATYTVDVDVNPGAPSGIITNTVSVTSATPDFFPDGNDDTEDTLIDADPPIVTLIDSQADTGDGALLECEEVKVPIHRLLASFNEPMQNPAGDVDPSDVTNPTNYQLVAAGPDGDFDTTACGPVFGDDVAVAIDSVTYDGDTRTALLAPAGTPLADSLYRLLVCEGVRDLAGNALDGDFDGTRGGDFTRGYRVDVANLFINGRFDCVLDPWLAVSTLPEEIAHSPDDFDASSVSGSARVTNLSASAEFSLGQCLAVDGGSSYVLSGSARVEAAPNVSLSLSRACNFFADPACGGAPLATEVKEISIGDTGGVWTPVASDVTAPATAAAALCSFDLQTLTGDDFDVHLDNLELRRPSEIFSDGFESGDTAAWSSSTPDP